MKSCWDTEARCKRKIRWNSVLGQVEERDPNRAFLSGFIENKRILIKMCISILTFIPKIAPVSVLLWGLDHIASNVSLPFISSILEWNWFSGFLSTCLQTYFWNNKLLWLPCEMGYAGRWIWTCYFLWLLKDAETLTVIIHLESSPSQDAGRLC